MFKVLKNYSTNGSFEYNLLDDLFTVCNAPNNDSGVYLFYKEFESLDNLIYIGCSGRIIQADLYTRKGGLKQRIAKGGQFNGKRFKTLKIKMYEDGITKLKVHWYVTFNNPITLHIPAYVEALLIQEYFDNYKKLPDWNKRY